MFVCAEKHNCATRGKTGDLFCRRINRPADFARLALRHKFAAINGCRKAQHRLCNLYARGQGVGPDLAEAYAWCKVAVFQKSRCARRKLKIIEARMSLQQLRRGRWLAQEYYDRFVANRLG